jgi:hypothetical protein
VETILLGRSDFSSTCGCALVSVRTCVFVLAVFTFFNIISLNLITTVEQQVGDSRREPKILGYVYILHIYEP